MEVCRRWGIFLYFENRWGENCAEVCFAEIKLKNETPIHSIMTDRSLSLKALNFVSKKLGIIYLYFWAIG